MTHFTEQWFPAPKRRRLAEAMAAVSATHGSVVEVGSWEGRSTIDIARHFDPAIVTAIDHWKGDLGNLANGVAARAAARDVHATFADNMAAATRGNWRELRSDWRDVDWKGLWPIRFLFIDGEHTYPEVADNIRAAAPLMLPGSVMAGDDFTIPAVARAVRDTIGEPVHHPGPGAAIWWKQF